MSPEGVQKKVLHKVLLRKTGSVIKRGDSDGSQEKGALKIEASVL